MTCRVLLRVPDSLDISQLTEEQTGAIESVFGQYVMPMPGTISFDGFKIVDAIADDNFNPDKMEDYGLLWDILGVWRENGEEILPLNRNIFSNHLPSSVPFHEPHRWAGWPELF